jgi:hypothetical protein
MTKEQQDTVTQAIHILHQLHGGKKWEIEVTDTLYDPDSLVFLKQIIVNGKAVELDEEAT